MARPVALKHERRFFVGVGKSHVVLKRGSYPPDDIGLFDSILKSLVEIHNTGSREDMLDLHRMLGAKVLDISRRKTCKMAGGALEREPMYTILG
jgi:hypothetical protein